MAKKEEIVVKPVVYQIILGWLLLGLGVFILFYRFGFILGIPLIFFGVYLILRTDVYSLFKYKFRWQKKKKTNLKGKYYGSIESDKYHYSTCFWEHKIREKHLILFKNHDDATEKGYRACKICRPPYLYP